MGLVTVSVSADYSIEITYSQIRQSPHSDRATIRSDEESTVGTPKSSETQSTHCRSSRHSLTLIPQDDGFNRFKTPLRMTSLTNYHSPPIPSFRQSERSKRRGIYSWYYAVKRNSKYLLEILTSLRSTG